jgi:hypothetical protein
MERGSAGEKKLSRDLHAIGAVFVGSGPEGTWRLP